MKKPFMEYICGICLAEYQYKPKKCNKCGTVFEKESSPEIEDKINKPNHYHKNEIDVNGYLEKHFPKTPNVTVAEGFYIGNVIKYVSRYKEKNGIQDLQKAKFNLNKLIELENEHEKA